MRLRECVRGLKKISLNGGSVVFNQTTSTACLLLWPRHPRRNFTNRSSRKPRGGESCAISWTFRSSAIFTIRRWCNAERCKLPYLLLDKARRWLNACESNLKSSLVRNTKRGLSTSARQETSCSPGNWILRNENACFISWLAERRLKSFAGSTNQQVRLAEFGDSADHRPPNSTPVSIISIRIMQSSARTAPRGGASLFLRTTASGA